MITWDELIDEQRLVAELDDPTALVLGGAGVGKTTTALWAARRLLTEVNRHPVRLSDRRALFVTFSRTAVTQIRSRTPGVLQGIESVHSRGYPDISNAVTSTYVVPAISSAFN